MGVEIEFFLGNFDFLINPFNPRVDTVTSLTYHRRTASRTSPAHLENNQRNWSSRLEAGSRHVAGPVLPACFRGIRSGLAGSYFPKLG